MKIDGDFGLYAVLTDPLKGYDYMTRLLVDEQVRFVQLRMKEVPHEEIRRVAEEMRKITEGTATLLIVNDHPAIAHVVGADGVHVGQDDMRYEEARGIVGSGAVVGISTHSPTQTRAACEKRPDYIGLGPVFTTPTKKIADPVIGLEGMKRMLLVSDRPAVAIGGIDLTNLRLVLESGARNFCMVRQINQVDDPRRIVIEARRIYCEVWS